LAKAASISGRIGDGRGAVAVIPFLATDRRSDAGPAVKAMLIITASFFSNLAQISVKACWTETMIIRHTCIPQIERIIRILIRQTSLNTNAVILTVEAAIDSLVFTICSLVSLTAIAMMLGLTIESRRRTASSIETKLVSTCNRTDTRFVFLAILSTFRGEILTVLSNIREATIFGSGAITQVLDYSIHHFQIACSAIETILISAAWYLFCSIKCAGYNVGHW
jgi:hypothetical protein